ncbi:energy-coupling factor transporter transmembrane protein EcfT [Lactococcus hircilactis]|uniref:Energy-coupling factor transporter transmembrane protein EcfT n=1 Tax=Lactococcus hircilactis TaxID=1494462 RepID=A0A7X1Z7J8_9LACT|nr:energy-coupling factor transporter transmembrane component T [Lactococcus hircilactis]MQW39245.1 energy-coupling factor transporter transmembrane protein EcfT [Lactococcus hircilactis]
MAKSFGYVARQTPIHAINGVSKLLMVLLVSIAVMMTYDTRFLIGIVILSLVMFQLAKIKFSEIKVLFIFIAIFMGINAIVIFLFSPNQGTVIYGSEHLLFHILGPYSLSLEEIFYILNVILKYFAVLPLALIFIMTTDPSEFAASLNRIGVSYKIAYAVALTLRYIPDIQRDFRNISQTQQARGIDTSKKAKLSRRIKNMTAILMPLVFTSLDRIDVITNAMELRGFGKNKKRTWYKTRPLQKRDFFMIFCSIFAIIVSIGLYFLNHGRFFNPFK